MEITVDSKKFHEIVKEVDEKCAPVQFNGPYAYMISKLSDVQHEFGKTGCYSSLTEITTPNGSLSNCRYVASWTDPETQRAVTIVEGSAWHIPFDLHIVFTNEFLHPLDFQDGGTPAKQFREVAYQQRRHDVKVGKTTPILHTDDQISRFAAGLVIQMTLTNSQTLTILEMKAGMKQILGSISDKSVNSVGISATACANNNDLVTQILETLYNSKVQSFFICCHAEVAECIKKVRNFFSNKRGVLQRFYNSDHKIEETGAQTKVILLKRAIEHVEVEVKVTMEKKRKQGPILKESKAQPNLPFKAVYTIALSDYHPGFKNELKMTMHQCLSKADRNSHKSIAFPSFATLYPSRETATAMYEAVNEYMEQAINSGLQTVYFAIQPDDVQTYKVFEEEQWRWSKDCENEVGVTRHFVKKEYMAVQQYFGNGLLVKVATLTEFGLPPPYAIQIAFGNGPEGFKNATAGPKTWNARYICKHIGGIKDLRKSLQDVISFFNSQPSTIWVIYPSLDISVEEQIQCVSQYLGTERSFRLSEVVIVVPDECLPKAEKQRFVEDSKTKVSINIFGDTPKDVQAAEKYVKTVVQKAEKDIEEQVLRQSCFPATHLMFNTKTDQISAEEDLIEPNRVSAELNPGIVKSFEGSEKLHSWIELVKNVFKIEILETKPSTALTVEGEMNNIFKFEDYLETRFPDDPAIVATSGAGAKEGSAIEYMDCE